MLINIFTFWENCKAALCHPSGNIIKPYGTSQNLFPLVQCYDFVYTLIPTVLKPRLIPIDYHDVYNFILIVYQNSGQIRP